MFLFFPKAYLSPLGTMANMPQSANCPVMDIQDIQELTTAQQPQLQPPMSGNGLMRPPYSPNLYNPMANTKSKPLHPANRARRHLLALHVLHDGDGFPTTTTSLTTTKTETETTDNILTIFETMSEEDSGQTTTQEPSSPPPPPDTNGDTLNNESKANDSGLIEDDIHYGQDVVSNHTVSNVLVQLITDQMSTQTDSNVMVGDDDNYIATTGQLANGQDVMIDSNYDQSVKPLPPAAEVLSHWLWFRLHQQRIKQRQLILSQLLLVKSLLESNSEDNDFLLLILPLIEQLQSKSHRSVRSKPLVFGGEILEIPSMFNETLHEYQIDSGCKLHAFSVLPCLCFLFQNVFG